MRICRAENGSFNPFVFSSLGSMGMAATVTSWHLAHLLSEKWKSLYSLIIGWLQCSLLLRSSLMYPQGFLPAQVVQLGVPVAIDLVTAEGHLAPGCD